VNIQTSQEHGYLLIRFPEPLVFGSDLTEVWKLVRTSVQDGCKRIALVFHRDSFFSSRVLGQLVGCVEELSDVDEKLVIVAPNMELRSALQAMSITSLVTVCSSLDDLPDAAG
jgi:hypothetical protein